MASGPDPDYVAQLFINCRKKLGFTTQIAFAKRLDCSPSLISRYELGLSSPSKWFIKNLKTEFPGFDPEREFYRRNGRKR